MTKSVPAFALVGSGPIYCPDTDGYQGTRSYVIERFTTRPEAQAAADDKNESGGEWSASVEMKPYCEGEGEINYPYSLLELRNHDLAVDRDELEAYYGR